jgi:hypothetical protein
MSSLYQHRLLPNEPVQRTLTAFALLTAEALARYW